MQTALAQSARANCGRAWFDDHLAEILARCRLFVRRLPRGERQDGVADIVASIFRYVVKAEYRGKLRLLTPFTLVWYFGRSYCLGRRFGGSNSTDVMSPAAQQKHGLRVVSLDRINEFVDTDRSTDEINRRDLEALSDSTYDQPAENARRNVDYPEMLSGRHVSAKARRVFKFLLQTNSVGQQVEVARSLGVSPARVTQLKAQLADRLAAFDYLPSSRPQPKTEHRRGRPPRDPIPLNAGTSPAPRDVAA